MKGQSINRALLILLLAAGAASPAEGQDVVKDIFQGPDGSQPGQIVAIGDTVFFFANDGETGNELWRSDGTEAGTQFIKEIMPGSLGAFAGSVIAAGDLIFFTALNENFRPRLFRSNGTFDGTWSVGDYNVPLAPVWQPTIGAGPGGVYFTVLGGPLGGELWKTDGTENGAEHVKSVRPIIPPPAGIAVPEPTFVATDDAIYFRASDPVHGVELWKSKGTEDSTYMVKDINPGIGTSSPKNLTPLGNLLYFTANDGETGDELWVTDGTLGGTSRVKNIREEGGSNPSRFIVAGGLLYFAADDGENGKELWKSDGTEDGTTLVKDIREGPEDAMISATFPLEHLMAAIGSEVFFVASDGTAKEIWKSDGTALGTVPVTSSDAKPAELTGFQGRLYFSASATGGGRKIFESDGTTGGTALLADARAYVAFADGRSIHRITPGENLLFFGGAHETLGAELWVYEPVDLDPSVVIQQLLAGLLDSGTISDADASRLSGRIEAAVEMAEAGNENAAANQLRGFIGQVEAMVQNGRLTDEEGAQLIAQAEAWMDALSEEADSEAANGTKARTASVRGNYPEPFNPQTTIQYSLDQDVHVQLTVFDLLGRRVAVLVDGFVAAGDHRATFDGSGLTSGIYLYRLEAGANIESGRMTLVK